MKNFAVIGLGRFGSSMAGFLEKEGGEVIAIDSSPEVVNDFEDRFTNVAEADATDIEALSELGVGDVDAAVVSIGTSMEAGILITLLLKELKVPVIVAKAQSKLHGRVLRKVGANLVVFPEEDAARHLAKKLYWPGYSELEMTAGLSIIEIQAPKYFINKTIAKLKLREKYNANVIAVKRKNPVLTQENQMDFEEEVIAPPRADTKIQNGDSIILICSGDSVDKFKELK